MHVSRLKKVEGELLTIVEAAISDKVQREAVKSLVRNCIGELWSWADHSKLTVGSIEEGTATYQKRLQKQDGSTSGGNKSPLPEGEIKII